MIWLGAVNDSIRTINSAFRTLLFAALVGGLGYAGWQGYAFYNQSQLELAEKDRELGEVRQELVDRNRDLELIRIELADKIEQLERAETSLRLLKLNHRIARIHVVEQTTDEDTNRITTAIEFYEVNDEGAPVDNQRRRFELEGDRVYVECLVAKFEDKYIEQTDLDRSTAICLFQRIFGEYQKPQEGFAIDEVGSSPTSYARGGAISEFEQKIWNDFWNIANDPQLAEEIGIRAAHADAPSIRVRPGMTYELELRSTGEFTLRPVVTGET